MQPQRAPREFAHQRGAGRFAASVDGPPRLVVARGTGHLVNHLQRIEQVGAVAPRRRGFLEVAELDALGDFGIQPSELLDDQRLRSRFVLDLHELLDHRGDRFGRALGDQVRPPVEVQLRFDLCADVAYEGARLVVEALQPRAHLVPQRAVFGRRRRFELLEQEVERLLVVRGLPTRHEMAQGGRQERPRIDFFAHHERLDRRIEEIRIERMERNHTFHRP